MTETDEPFRRYCQEYGLCNRVVFDSVWRMATDDARKESLRQMETTAFLMGVLYGLKSRVDNETRDDISKAINHAVGNYGLKVPVSLKHQQSEVSE